MDLLSQLDALSLGNEKQWFPEDQCIDDYLYEARPNKRTKTSPDLQAQLEKDFLTPSLTFDTAWLNKLQQRWPIQLDYSRLFEVSPTISRTVTRFERKGLEGRVSGYKEVTVPANSATAKNSTSFARKPASRADFVRGAAGFFPFAPGGLDGVQAVADFEEQSHRRTGEPEKQGNNLERIIDLKSKDGLLQIPPGFTRGLEERQVTKDVDRENEVKTSEIIESETPAIALQTGGVEIQEDVNESQEPEVNEDADRDIDELLPVEFAAFEPRAPLASLSRKKGRQWAHMVDVTRPMTNFHELVPQMAKEWPFELDTFQKEAVYHLENGDSVFVAAHTSAGKTVVAEYAIALAAKHMTKAIYTSPIKALSNQKFRDFKNTFDDVGILTGDVQINPEASCLIMTTEILRSMLYRGADLIRDVEYVIFDEVHYVNDLERGVVWEEVIIMLPEHVSLILLSATVPNTYEFASWVGRTKRKDIYVISTPKRPVPLEHYLWANKAMHKIVNADKKFLDKGWKEANDALSGRDKIKAAPEQSSDHNDSPRGGRGGQRGNDSRGRGGRGGQAQGRGGAQQRGRGQATPQGRGNIARTGRGGGRTSAAQDRNIWVHLVQHLRKEELLPGCIFVFSKKRCEENADALSNLDFCTATEKSAIHMILEKSIARLKQDDRGLPQIRRIREMLGRGIAVHHGGLLPIVKEVVEILFARTLVKVLFATETFAMGLNLPTRTVVFSGFRKHDGRSFRDLLPGEYTQMAGRAGRRGLDTVGSVIIVSSGSDEAPPVTTLRQMILGDPTKLRSQFRLTYNMILNLLRVEALKIEEMIKRSFSENATQALLPEHEKQVKVSEADLAKIKRKPCTVCDQDLEACHDAAMEYEAATADFHMSLTASAAGRRLITSKPLIVFRKDGIRTAGIVLSDGKSKSALKSLQVLSFGAIVSTRQSSDILPFLPSMRKLFTPLPKTAAEMTLKVIMVPMTDIECFTKTTVKLEVPQWYLNIRQESEKIAFALEKTLRSWKADTWQEFPWKSRIREVNLREILEARMQAAKTAEKAACVKCPDFVNHFAMAHDEWLIREHITKLRQLMSDQNLQLLPDYEQRIEVLKDLGFVDDSLRVELKGKVACEIHSADELVLTELVLENVLADYEPEEIVALLSAFVFQEKTDTVPTLTANLQRGMESIVRISEKVNDIQILHQVIQSSNDSNDFVSRPRFGLVEVVYEWARGMPFSRITDLTDVLEGTIVRVITRLDETCREAKNAARIIGDPKLYLKMQTAQELIRRDITAVASLYM